MSNKEMALLDFGVILEEDRNFYGENGTVFFAPITKWSTSMLYSKLNYPVTVSDIPFNHRVYGTGYAVFVPD